MLGFRPSGVAQRHDTIGFELQLSSRFHNQADFHSVFAKGFPRHKAQLQSRSLQDCVQASVDLNGKRQPAGDVIKQKGKVSGDTDKREKRKSLTQPAILVLVSLLLSHSVRCSIEPTKRKREKSSKLDFC